MNMFNQLDPAHLPHTPFLSHSMNTSERGGVLHGPAVYETLFTVMTAADAAYRYMDAQESLPENPFSATQIATNAELANENMQQCASLVKDIGGIPVRITLEDGSFTERHLLGPRLYREGKWAMVIKGALHEVDPNIYQTTEELRMHHQAFYDLRPEPS